MNLGFLLDTNVLSELMREQPHPQVLDWFASQTVNQLLTSAVTHAEILTGIALLPAGKRRQAMALAASQIFEEDFMGRCIDFGGLAVAHTLWSKHNASWLADRSTQQTHKSPPLPWPST